MEPIAAISTARGVAAAVGVLRVSGDGAVAAAEAVVRRLGGAKLAEAPARTLVRCSLLDCTGAVIDDCLAVVFPAPHSYTGEDVVELQCHGSPVVLEEGLRALLAAGARQAKPGEFTKRAFLNGRMDLTAAEAVIDLIDAETAEEARNAAMQVNGALVRAVGAVYDMLMDVAARFYAVVDYPDEDIAPLQRTELEEALKTGEKTLQALVDTTERGRILKRGVPTVIVGRPNVGKSSLLNALLGFDRAIVTDVAGTTRDTVEEKVLCGGVLLRLTDTAGIRETEDAVEKIGVERSRSALEQASLVLAVLDSAAEVTPEDQALLRQAAEQGRWILVWSKRDLTEGRPLPAIDQILEDLDHLPAAVVALSNVTGQGLEDLERAVAALYPAGETAAGTVVTNSRQSAAIERALTAVRSALGALRGGLTPDAVLTDAEEALDALGELTGKTIREDLVETIFSRFCVGK